MQHFTRLCECTMDWARRSWYAGWCRFLRRVIQVKLGASVACGVFLGLILIPPVIAPFLDEWQVAVSELPTRNEIIAACGNDSRVQLSRWRYSFRVTGAKGRAHFNGKVSSPRCNRSFVVELERANYVWRIASVKLDES